MENSSKTYFESHGKVDIEGVFTGTVWDVKKGELSIRRDEISQYIGIGESLDDRSFPIEPYICAYISNVNIENPIIDQGIEILNAAINDPGNLIAVKDIGCLIVSAALMGYVPALELYDQIDTDHNLKLKPDTNLREYFCNCIELPKPFDFDYCLSNLIDVSIGNAMNQPMTKEDIDFFDVYEIVDDEDEFT